MQFIKRTFNYIRYNISIKKALVIFFASGVLAFGLYNIHSVSNVTEGGILGLTLLIEHWFNISPSISGFILNGISYIIGFKLLGKSFMLYSMVATCGFSSFYAFFECFEPIYPSIADKPLLAAILGGLVVGVSCGICVKEGAATSGDDALAMCIASFGFKIENIYLLSDLVILILSLTYIPFSRIVYSLLTVLISGKVIGIVQNIEFNKQAHLLKV